MAGIVEAVRRNTIGFLEDYFILLDVREQNRKLHADNDQLRMANIYFRNQLSTAVNAQALTAFQKEIPSKTIAARVIGNSTVVTAKAVFIDRGTTGGIATGMPVVTAEGIVGKVSAAYPLVSQVLLVTDPTFKVGVESQKGHVHGVMDCGSGQCVVEQIENEDKIGVGEWFYTSGEDRVFPRGFPVGEVVSAQPGQGMKDVRLNLSGAPGGVDEVLVVQTGVHRQIPDTPPVEQTNVAMLPAPPPDEKAKDPQSPKGATQAEQIMRKYSDIGKEQGHVYGGYGSNLPNFNVKPENEQPSADELKKSASKETGSTAAPAPGKTAAENSTVLGARPGTKTPPAAIPNKAPQPTPVLPLGAPRHKAAPPQQ